VRGIDGGMNTLKSKANPRWIPVFLKENDLPEREFEHLQECFRYLRSLEQFNACTDNGIYKVINLGIDDDMTHRGFSFRTTVEVKAKRAGRKTR
jgi:hypothetical protein